MFFKVKLFGVFLKFRHKRFFRVKPVTCTTVGLSADVGYQSIPPAGGEEEQGGGYFERNTQKLMGSVPE